MRKASLKHLTFKTVFLLALGSSKRQSEIHAWLYRNIRHQENWSQVSLYPSPSFLSKNQLARDGPAAVAPMVIPTLAPSLDKSLKDDKSATIWTGPRIYERAKSWFLCRSGRAFRRTLFRLLSLPGSSRRCCCAINSQVYIKFGLMMFRAFAASKAFQGGVSLDQILSACHWKAHNTFTQFYLKDLAWADSELYHLGPVIAAQQIHEDKQ